MLNKKQLLVFPSSRAIRDFLSCQKSLNTLLPTTLTIDDFLKKSIYFENRTYAQEEQRTLFLSEAIKNIDISKLGINSSFTKFLTQSEYIYRFFLEISSEKVDILQIQSFDTYEFYSEHLEILQEVYKNYIEILDKNNFVDRINLAQNYKINQSFFDRFEEIIIHFEGYFTKVEFEIVKNISQIKDLKIKFFSNIYNQKSLNVFKDIIENRKIDYEYFLDLTNQKVIEETPIKSKTQNLEIKGFSSRLNQIAYIKSTIVSSVKNGVKPENIAVVLPDESFAQSLQLFDDEKYFNFAMGKQILNKDIYQRANAIYLYLSDDEQKNISNLKYLQIDRKYIDENIRIFWNKVCTKDRFSDIFNFIRKDEKDSELIEKLDELFYKLEIILFSKNNDIKLKDIYKIFLQKFAKLSLDDVNSGKVTVLGLLETRALSFDTIIICDFNESFIPKISLKDKFLSTKLKELSNLPTKQDRESLQKYYYKRLCDSSKNIFVSYVNSQTNHISRFANELFKNSIKTDTNDNLYKEILYKNHKLEYIEEEITLDIDLTKISWSASSFKKFLDCKRKYYLENILKIKNHTISKVPENFELGSIIHKILEDLFTEFDLSKEKLEELFLKYRSENPFLILELEVWKKNLFKFLELEKERIKHRKIISLEQKFTSVFNGININGVIDRIDFHEDNYELIDYKTSSSLSVDTLKNYEKSKDFQLEFYYLASVELFKTANIKSFYYDLYNITLVEEIALEAKIELLRVKFDELKELSLKPISFDKTQDKMTCQFCNFKIICNKE